MNIRVLGGIGLMCLLTVPAAALGSAGPPTPSELVTRAQSKSIERDPACNLPGAPRPAVMSDAQPDPAVAEHLAILRRPQTDADLAAADRLASLPTGNTILRPGARVAQGPDGRTYDVAPVTATSPRPAYCSAIEDRFVRRALRKASPKLRRDTQVLLRRVQSHPRFDPSTRVGVAVATVPGGAYGGGAGPTVAELAAGQTGLGVVGLVAGKPTLLYGLVRDGVASVTWRFPGGNEVTAPVQDNIAAVEVDFRWVSYVPERTLLRDASGAVIADVPGPPTR